jgi:type IV pilus assembly protein PilV
MKRPEQQRGAMLIEALIGVFIFSIGILAVVAMQGRAMAQVTDAKYRIEASYLANEIVSQMWVDRDNLGNYVLPGGGAAALVLWQAKVAALLPGTAANPPTIAVSAGTGQVTVTVNWQAPNATTPSRHTVLAVVVNP